MALLGVAVAYQALAGCVVAPLTPVASARAIGAATGPAAAVNSSLVRLFPSPVSRLLLGASLLLAVAAQQLAAGASAHVVRDGFGPLPRFDPPAADSAGCSRSHRAAMPSSRSRACHPRARAARLRGGVRARDPVAAWARGSQALITIGAALAMVLLVLWVYLSLRWAFARPVRRTRIPRSRGVAQEPTPHEWDSCSGSCVES